jgi:hypothetical protein
LDEESTRRARLHVVNDLRETLTVPGARRVGASLEILPEPHAQCSPLLLQAPGVVVTSCASPVSGTLARVRYKSGRAFSASDRVRVAVGQVDAQGQFQVQAEALVRLHAMGAHIHQEHDVELAIRADDVVALITTDGSSLMIEMRAYDNPSTLVGDVVGKLDRNQRRHPVVNDVMSRVDVNLRFPAFEVAAKSRDGFALLTKDLKVLPLPNACPLLLFNYDVLGAA